MTFVPFVGRRADWLALAAALQRQDEARLADFIRAGLAFGTLGRDPAVATLGIPEPVAATVRAVAVELRLELTLVDDRVAAVAAAEAIVRAGRRGAP